MKKQLKISLFALLLGLLTSFAPLGARAQCVMCKSQVEAARQEKDDYDVTGLNRGIVYMMSVPYLLMGAIGYFWYRRSHAAKKGRS
ncbi:hypothetical protein [uncultured Hymenobacter sp.]|uniref:hypothetical protein n=1 Tax=uncultured Hymenobacter sp. TaxID=170016 RepID=UPI0035C9B781